MHWVLIAFLAQHTGMLTWMGYSTEARCQAARTVLLRETDIPARHTACIPSDDVLSPAPSSGATTQNDHHDHHHD
jgi:hypothetical protein